MSKHAKLLEKVLSGTADAAIPFDSLCRLLIRLGFTRRIKGSHHIFFKLDVAEIINIQPRGSNAKPYQVKQVRNLIVKYKLATGDL
jgi:hypothetical protein